MGKRKRYPLTEDVLFWLNQEGIKASTDEFRNSIVFEYYLSDNTVVSVVVEPQEISAFSNCPTLYDISTIYGYYCYISTASSIGVTYDQVKFRVKHGLDRAIEMRGGLEG